MKTEKAVESFENLHVSVKDIINWKQVSRILAGNETSIRKNKHPQKYARAIDNMLIMLELWDKIYLRGESVPVELDLSVLLSKLAK